jgi:hypothetical protein
VSAIWLAPEVHGMGDPCSPFSGFIAAPGAVMVAHVWTEIPLRWLRRLGWTRVRTEQRESNLTCSPVNVPTH